MKGPMLEGDVCMRGQVYERSYVGIFIRTEYSNQGCNRK